MSIISKVDLSSIHISDLIDRLRSASDKRLEKIVDEVNDADLIRAFNVLDDNTCFKILQHVDDLRLVRLFVSFDSETIENVFSWRNTEISSRVIKSCLKDENVSLFMRIFNVINKCVLNTALAELSQMLLANLMLSIVTSNAVPQNRNYRVSLILNYLITNNRLNEIFECMTDIHISTLLSIPIMSNVELNKAISGIDDSRLRSVIKLIDNYALGYILSQIDSVSLVRRLAIK